MTAMQIVHALREGYETSTRRANRFDRAIACIPWDEQFDADGEHYYIKDGLTLVTPSLDPFDMPWRPAAHFDDGSWVEL